MNILKDKLLKIVIEICLLIYKLKGTIINHNF